MEVQGPGNTVEWTETKEKASSRATLQEQR